MKTKTSLVAILVLACFTAGMFIGCQQSAPPVVTTSPPAVVVAPTSQPSGAIALPAATTTTTTTTQNLANGIETAGQVATAVAPVTGVASPWVGIAGMLLLTIGGLMGGKSMLASHTAQVQAISATAAAATAALSAAHQTQAAQVTSLISTVATQVANATAAPKA